MAIPRGWPNSQMCLSLSDRFQQCPRHHHWLEEESDGWHPGPGFPQREDGTDVQGKNCPKSHTRTQRWEKEDGVTPFLGPGAVTNIILKENSSHIYLK